MRQRTTRSAPVRITLVLFVFTLLLAACGGGDDTAAPEPAEPSAADQPAATGECDFTAPDEAPSGKQYPKAPAMTIDPAGSYVAEMETSCGTMRIDLLAGSAPQTVNNFVFLAEEGWYDGVRFHRLANSISVIQAGDPQCSDRANPACGSGGPGYRFEDELSGKEKYVAGVVAMANAGPNTNGSQFFIVTGPNAAQLPPAYTIFGELADAESLEVARTIQELPVGGEDPVDDIWIRSIAIED